MHSAGAWNEMIGVNPNFDVEEAGCVGVCVIHNALAVECLNSAKNNDFNPAIQERLVQKATNYYSKNFIVHTSSVRSDDQYDQRRNRSQVNISGP